MRFRSLAVAVLAASATLGAQEPVTAIRTARVLDGTGRTIPNATVVVRGSRIIAVGPNVPVPAGARVYDLSTLTLLPGLIDAHAHIAWHFNPQGRYHAGNDGETEFEGALAMAGNANATLRAGITIKHMASLETADVYTLSGSNSTPARQASLSKVATNAFSYVMPARSVSTLVFRP